MHYSIIEIDSKQFVQNLNAIRMHTNQAVSVAVSNNATSSITGTPKRSVKICLPVKANAYGHGLVGMAHLAKDHVDYLAVACLDEGVILRQSGINIPILVFGAFSEQQIEGLIKYNLEITISSLLKAKLINEYCHKHNLTCKVQIKVDTGMNRVGVRVENALNLIQYVLSHKAHLQLTGVYSHLANSDEVDSAITYDQIEEFTKLVHAVKQIDPQITCHIANSGAVCYYPEAYFDMVRPGILSYGYFPGPVIDQFPLNQIRPCFKLKSQVSYFKVVAAGQGISYDHRYITKAKTRVVTVPVGYGDGYRRALSNYGEVLIRGKRYTISGNICMDMFMVDIGPRGESYVGDEVVLIGQQGEEEITLETVAYKCNTIVYEILCGFNNRIPRIYLS
jgi:alanine racemase